MPPTDDDKRETYDISLSPNEVRTRLDIEERNKTKRRHLANAPTSTSQTISKTFTDLGRPGASFSLDISLVETHNVKLDKAHKPYDLTEDQKLFLHFRPLHRSDDTSPPWKDFSTRLREKLWASHFRDIDEGENDAFVWPSGTTDHAYEYMIIDPKPSLKTLFETVAQAVREVNNEIKKSPAQDTTPDLPGISLTRPEIALSKSETNPPANTSPEDLPTTPDMEIPEWRDRLRNRKPRSLE